MKKRATFTVDEDVFEELKFVPRGFSVSEFVSFMLRGMLQELKGGRVTSQEGFEKWVESDPELKRIREAMREAWGPTVWKAEDKVKEVTENVRKKLGDAKKRKNV